MAPKASVSTWLLGSEFERRGSSYQKAASGVMLLGDDLVSVNLGIMWAKQGSPLLQAAQDKARALWQGSQKTWSGVRTQKGYLAHQKMIQDEFARTKKAGVLRPILTSPFPRWIAIWQTQLVGRELYGVSLPKEGLIVAESFTCNAWDGCWAVAQSDELAEWVLSKAPTPADSGVSPSAAPPSLQAVADIVAKALPTLTEAGAPVVIALRTMATAISSIARSHGRELVYGFAAGWPPETLALGFIGRAQVRVDWKHERELVHYGQFAGQPCSARRSFRLYLFRASDDCLEARRSLL